MNHTVQLFSNSMVRLIIDYVDKCGEKKVMNIKFDCKKI